MSCLDNTDILRIVGGNSFQIAITVKARRVSDGSEIEDFDLSASSPVLNLIHAGEKTRKYFVTQGNQAIISFDGSEGLGYYGMEMSGSYNSEAWRFCIEKVLQLVDTNAKANIPEWSVLVDDTYFVEGTISIYGGGGGGDTVQADWTETNPTSAAFILHKPDLSVYATKTEVASGLAGKQDVIEDLSTIRSGAAAGATAYQKPGTGIPESDMSEGVQSALDKADSAYQKPVSGIPATDMSESVQAALEKANSAVQTETDPVFSNSPAAEISQNDINSWNAKQSAIADLADIREGAAAGATAVQPDEMAQAIDEVDGDIADINAKIPTAASNLNQLADKAYVNSSIATNSATYRGSFNLITDLGMNIDATHAQIAGALATAIVTADNNDYAFVQIPDSASTPTVIAKIERYKHNGSGWVYEYDLNNSGFTSAQWAAINSGITSGLVGKLADLPNNSELATLLNGKQNVINDLSAIRSGASAGATAVQPADLTEALNGVEAEIAGLDESKQDTIEDLSTIRSGAAAGATAYQKPSSGIPESDMSEGVQSALDKADSAYQKPASGIPATDMSESVQAALEKANSAVQTETDPVFSNSPAAEITQADINNWNAKQSAIADLADIREGAAAGATAVQPDEMAQAIGVVDGDIADINAKIPSTASNLNQLADKAYVNSSIATNSATYRGSFNLITDLGMNVDATHAQIAGALATAITTADNNDYSFVQIPDSASTPTVIAKIERYKHNGSGWVYEYDLNNSGFTAAQWAAINSGITSGLVGKLADLPNNSELATLLNGKQNVINDLSTIRSGAAAGATAYQKPSGGIPASDMSGTVQQELSKANTAVQTETDPIFSASPAAGITAQNIQTWNGEPAARQAADTALQTAIQNEATARATADALLQQQYNALTQSDIIVGALPATGVPNVIYRVPGTTDFTDYMWYDNQFVPMATYGLPISAEFVEDNNLNKTQEEVNELAAGVFDISVANAVGGTPTTYADLSAALGTNGANVPQGFRKGGMSVKFVQTSDNNYVQYLYKVTDAATASKFTNVANWEKVNLEEEVKGKLDILPGINLYNKDGLQNGSFLSNGSLYDGTGHYHTGYIKVKPSTSYYLSNSLNSLSTSARYYMFYKEDKTLCATPSVVGTSGNYITITTPADCYYVRLSVVVPRDDTMFNEGTSRPSSFIPYNPVGGYSVQDGTITTAKIADSAITEDKIANNAVTGGKIPDGTITTDKIADSAANIRKISFTECENNLIDTTKLVFGFLKSDGSINDSTTYKTTDYIAVSSGSKYYVNASDYSNHFARFVCLYDSQKNYVANTYATDVLTQITIPSGVAYLRASYYETFWGHMQITKDVSISYEEYKLYISPDVIKPVGTDKIKDGAITSAKLSPEIEIPVAPTPFNSLSVSGNVDDAIYLSSPVQIIKNACVTGVINGEITSSGVAIGLGYDESVTSKRKLYAHWLVIKPTTVEVHRFTGSEDVLIYTYEHGLTLTNKTFVYIKKADGNNLSASFKISTDLGSVYNHDINWYGEGKPFIQNYGNTEISGIVSLMPMDMTKKVWLFGDSYCGFWNADRWPYYLMADGNVSYLLDALAGEAPSGGYADLETLLSTGAIPTYLVWCLGMNGGSDTYDSSTGTYVINDTQKSYVDAVVAKCTLNKIIPIFATIPSVPSGRHTGYNDYIKSLGVRYIDFDAAVSAQPDGTWNAGLLSSDNVHPTGAGAKVLYAQALVDCPELTIKD